MNHLGNIHSSFFANSYQYANADGSRYFSNPDGSAYYHPGTSGKGKKWFRDPHGEKHFISDSDSDDTVYLASSPEKVATSGRGGGPVNASPRTPSKPKKAAASTPTKPKTPKTPVTPKKSPVKTVIRTPSKTVVTPKTSPAKKPATPRKSPAKEKEVHIHIHKKPAAPPMNVTRVVHHSSKGEKEIVYKSPAKVGKDGKIGKGEKKVVHIHHH